MLPGRRISPSCCCCYRDRREMKSLDYPRWWLLPPLEQICAVFEILLRPCICIRHHHLPKWCGAKRIPWAGCQRPVQPPNTIVFINLHGRGGHHSLLALSIVIGSRSQIGDLGLVIVLLSMDVEWISNRFVILKTADRVTITWTERIINRKLSQPICLS